MGVEQARENHEVLATERHWIAYGDALGGRLIRAFREEIAALGAGAMIKS